MNAIEKHKFEAVSLLSVHNGQLDVSILPVAEQPDWIVPTTLILDTIPFEPSVFDKMSAKKPSKKKPSKRQAFKKKMSELKASQQKANEKQAVESCRWKEQELAVYKLCTEQQIHDTSAAKSVVVLEGIDDEYRVGLLVVGAIDALKVGIADVTDVENKSVTNNDEKLEINAETDSTGYQLQNVVINQTVYTVPDLDKLACQLVSA